MLLARSDTNQLTFVDLPYSNYAIFLTLANINLKKKSSQTLISKLSLATCQC
jgi:hypothetical protein